VGAALLEFSAAAGAKDGLKASLEASRNGKLQQKPKIMG